VLAGLADVPADLHVTDITQDSREVVAGGAFLACRGHTHHGLEYAARAVAAGARVIVWESEPGIEPPPLGAGVVLFEVPRLRTELGVIADRFFGMPSTRLQIVAVTGTNGKTTCAWLLAQALTLLGRRAAYLGTLGVGTPPSVQPLTHTTPDAVTLHRLLAQLVSAGTDALSMEVSSHALAQERCAGVRLHTAAFTNLTRDHLDYHGDMARYGAAKAKLLEWPRLRARVINVDDAFGATLAARYRDSGEPAGGGDSAARPLLFVTSSRQPGIGGARGESDYVCARRVVTTATGLELDVESSRGRARLVSALRGAFNAENLLTCLAVLLAADVPLERACATLARCESAPGRLQSEGGAGLPRVLIDYAHSPDALAAALAAARAECRGKLWVVFGCGGERDAGKRPEMGRIAAEAADEVIVTDDNPRREDPGQITAAILSGIESVRAARASGGADSAKVASTAVRVIHNRGEAIVRAIEEAVPIDVVLVAGKGHEDYQLIGSERRVFSDTACVRLALAARAHLGSLPAQSHS
jgi:UDP-N-acetylmuramoyl-L-alanyl-D-glutamate--2,6-diaminopimelate ligase